VNLNVRRTLGAGAGDVLGRHALAALLNMAGNVQQSLELRRDRCRFKVAFDLGNERKVAIEIATQVVNRSRAVADLAMISRSALLSEFGPRSRISASSRMGFAVSGRNAKGPVMPGSPSGRVMCAMVCLLCVTDDYWVISAGAGWMRTSAESFELLWML
jgi:hypothetical protein